MSLGFVPPVLFGRIIRYDHVICFIHYHRVLEQEEGLTNYTKSSDTIRLAGATPLTTPMFGQITEFRFFEKINFFDFGGAQKFFF